jgi:hypothetical protein
MPNPMKIVFAAMTASLLAGACQTPAPTQTFADITFTHLEPLKIRVAEIEVENTYKSGSDGKHVESRFPVPPVKALERWVADRLQPVGGPDSGKLRLVITHAGVLETELVKDKTVTGAFTKQQTHRYELEAGGRLEIYDAAGTRVGHSESRAKRSITTPEGLSLNEREKIWFDVTERLMADFDREMEKNIRQYLAAWLK